MRISDWSSDVCSSDLHGVGGCFEAGQQIGGEPSVGAAPAVVAGQLLDQRPQRRRDRSEGGGRLPDRKSVVLGKRVAVRVELGGSSIIKQNTVTRQVK